MLLQEWQCTAWQQPPRELSGVVAGQQSSQWAHGHLPYKHQQQLWSPPGCKCIRCGKSLVCLSSGQYDVELIMHCNSCHDPWMGSGSLQDAKLTARCTACSMYKELVNKVHAALKAAIVKVLQIDTAHGMPMPLSLVRISLKRGMP